MQIDVPSSSVTVLAPSAEAAPSLAERYRTVRRCTEGLCEPLETEDYVIQTMTDVSPTRWHLAHVSWFFETFILKPLLPGYEPLDAQYSYLFNSYYVQAAFDDLLRGHHFVGQEFKVDEGCFIGRITSCCCSVSYDDQIKAVLNGISSV